MEQEIQKYILNHIHIDPDTPEFIRMHLNHYVTLMAVTENIDQDLKNQVSLMSAIGYLLALYEKKTAKLFIETKKTLGGSDKRVTNDEVTKTVEASDVGMITEFLKLMHKAVEQRGRMLEQLSNNQRRLNKE